MRIRIFKGHIDFRLNIDYRKLKDKRKTELKAAIT